MVLPHKYLLIIIITLFIVGCATGIEVVKTQDYNSNASVTIVPRGSDYLGIQSRLEHKFLSQGFNVISESTALEKIKYSESTTTNSGSKKEEGEITQIKEIISIYSITFDYETRVDFPAGEVFSSFSSSVVRMSDGQLVASADFSQGQMTGKTIDKVLDQFVEKLLE